MSALGFLKGTLDNIIKSRKQDKIIVFFSSIAMIATGFTFAEYNVVRIIITLGLWVLTFFAYYEKLKDLQHERDAKLQDIKWNFVQEAYKDHASLKHDLLSEESMFYHRRIWNSINTLVFFTKNFDTSTPHAEEFIDKLIDLIRDSAHGLADLGAKVNQPYKSFLQGETLEGVPIPSSDDEVGGDIEFVRDEIDNLEDMTSI